METKTVKIIRATLNLSRASEYINGDFDLRILQGLEKAELLSDDFVYTVFNSKRSRTVAETGLTIPPSENVFYAFRRNELVWDNGNANCLRVCVRQQLYPALAIYDSSFIEPAYLSNSNFGYEYIEGVDPRDALRGIVRLVMPNA